MKSFFSVFLAGAFVSNMLFPVVFAQSEDFSVEIVFDISGSMADPLFVGDDLSEDEKLSFFQSVMAQELEGDFEAYDISELPEMPEIEIETFVLPEPFAIEPVFPEIVDPLNIGNFPYEELFDPYLNDPDYSRKIDVAREVLSSTLFDLDPSVETAFRVFGASCSFTELKVDFAAQNAQKISEIAQDLQPLFDTPLALAISDAGEDLAKRSGRKKMIVITDGEETCGGDVLAEARKLKGIELLADVIYFGEGDLSGSELQEFADIVGGSFIQTVSGDGLRKALDESFSEVAPLQWYWLFFARILFLLFVLILVLRCRYCHSSKIKKNKKT